jgi:hypothetical protein
LIRTRMEAALSASRTQAASFDDLSKLELTDLGVEVMFEVLERTGAWEAFGARVPEIAAQRYEWKRRKGSALAGIRTDSV